MSKKPYNGRPKLEQLPYLRENYRGRNMSGGRQTYFRQSREYKNSASNASQWYGYGTWINGLNKNNGA